MSKKAKPITVDELLTQQTEVGRARAYYEVHGYPAGFQEQLEATSKRIQRQLIEARGSKPAEPTVTEAINAAIVQAVTEVPHDSQWLNALATALRAVTPEPQTGIRVRESE